MSKDNINQEIDKGDVDVKQEGENEEPELAVRMNSY